MPRKNVKPTTWCFVAAVVPVFRRHQAEPKERSARDMEDGGGILLGDAGLPRDQRVLAKLTSGSSILDRRSLRSVAGTIWYAIMGYGTVLYTRYMIWNGMVWFDAMRSTVILYGMVLYGMIWCEDLVWCCIPGSVLCCGMVWYDMVWCSMVWIWYGVVWCGVAWYGMVWYSTVPYDGIWYDIAWYYFWAALPLLDCFLVVSLFGIFQVRCAVAWFGVVWYGMAWCLYYTLWHGMA